MLNAGYTRKHVRAHVTYEVFILRSIILRVYVRYIPVCIQTAVTRYYYSVCLIIIVYTAVHKCHVQSICKCTNRDVNGGTHDDNRVRARGCACDLTHPSQNVNYDGGVGSVCCDDHGSHKAITYSVLCSVPGTKSSHCSTKAAAVKTENMENEKKKKGLKTVHLFRTRQ